MKAIALTKPALAAFAASLCLAVPAVAGEHRLDAYNIVWDSPSKNSSESMPCGGGDIGLNVWVEDGDILFYMQRSGSLAEQNEYLKLGRMRVTLDPNPFLEPDRSFRQELKLREGHVEIESADGDDSTLVRIWTEVHRPVIHVEIESSTPVDASATYENWRIEDEAMTRRGHRRRSCFSMHQYPGELILGRDHIAHTEDGILFHHRNPEDTVIDIVIEQQELQAHRDEIGNDLKNRTFGGMVVADGFVEDGTTEGSYHITPFGGWKITSEQPAENHAIRIVTHIDQTDTLELWKDELEKSVAASASDRDQARERTLAWWADFWERSWIIIDPENPDAENPAWRIARNYNLFRYQLGTNVFGEYPSKFNGGNFTFDADHVGALGTNQGPDWRNWGGGVFTAQNQRLLHWPMLKAGDFDAIHSQFELYRKALPGAKARVRANFDHDGAMYSEYIGVPGIAFGAGYGWESGVRVRGPENPFGDPRADAAHAYGDPVEKGIMSNRAVSFHWESQLEHSWMIMEYHRFTGNDIARYIPFIENSLIFFDEHYRKREKMRTGNELTDDGELHIFPSTACESFRGATNPADVTAGLHACLESILKLDPSLLSLRDPDYYREFLGTLPPYPYGEVEIGRIMRPAQSWLRRQNAEAPQFYPVFPFDRFNLLVDDPEHLEIFNNTWDHGGFVQGRVRSWHQDGIFLSRLGRTGEAAAYNLKKLEDSERRYPTFWGPGHDWVPDHNWGGTGMLGLQEMLMHTIGDTILLFPAWPEDWDVDFKLHAPRQTTVQARLRNGQIEELIVTPEERREDLIISPAFDR